MNLKVKNTLIISGTLVLGLILGMLICGRYTKMRLNNFRNFYTEKGFVKQFVKTVHPSPEQMKQLKPLFKENLDKNRALIKECKENKRMLYQEFRKKASEILTPEQLEKLDKLEQRHQRMLRKKAHHRAKKFPQRGKPLPPKPH